MKVRAMIHSLGDVDNAIIVKMENNNNIIAEYKGKKYRAVFNVFTNLYYVDDKFGEIEEDEKV
jgi:hypothetical protein